jgi:iron-sulfur cluster repair protein YtfE (RIC family)
VGAAIDPDISVEDLVRQIPEASAILRRFGIVCIQCGEPVWGTLRQAAAERGIFELSEILDALQDDR